MKLKISSQSGFSLIESIIASLIILFIISSAFYLLQSVMMRMYVEQNRQEIYTQLSNRANTYRITGVLDLSDSSDITFEKKEVSSVAVNSDNPQQEGSVLMKLIEVSGHNDKSGITVSVPLLERQEG